MIEKKTTDTNFVKPINDIPFDQKQKSCKETYMLFYKISNYLDKLICNDKNVL